MSQNNDYLEFLEKQFPRINPQFSEETVPSTQAKDKWPKIIVMALFGLLAFILFIVAINTVVTVLIGLVCLGVVLALFAGAGK